MRYPLKSMGAARVFALVLALGSRVHAGTVPVDALIERAARDELLAQAREAALANPAIQVELRTHGPQAARACPQAVEVEALDTRFVTRMRFAAHCPATPGWRTEYVVRGAIEAEVIVAASAINAGQTIGVAQLERARRDTSLTPGALSDIDSVAGKSSQRALHRGQIIDKRWLVEPVLVKRGAAVSIVARNGSIEVQAPGESMEDGRRDMIVRVRNTLNGKIIRARVISDGVVEPADMPSP